MMPEEGDFSMVLGFHQIFSLLTYSLSMMFLSSVQVPEGMQKC